MGQRLPWTMWAMKRLPWALFRPPPVFKEGPPWSVRVYLFIMSGFVKDLLFFFHQPGR